MTNREKPAEECPTAWFCVLERARIDGDKARERAALRELRRLGVRVEWPAKPARGKKGGGR